MCTSACVRVITLFFFVLWFNPIVTVFHKQQIIIIRIIYSFFPLQGLLNVTDEELKDAGIEDSAHRDTMLCQLARHRQRLDPYSGDTNWTQQQHIQTETTNHTVSPRARFRYT